MESWHQLPAEEDPSQFLAHTSALHEITCQHSATASHEGELFVTGDTQTQRVTDKFESLQLGKHKSDDCYHTQNCSLNKRSL